MKGLSRTSRRAFVAGVLTLPVLGGCIRQGDGDTLTDRLLAMAQTVPLFSGIPRLGLLAHLATLWRYPEAVDSDPIGDLAANFFGASTLEAALAPLRAKPVEIPPAIPLTHDLADHADLLHRQLHQGYGDREAWIAERTADGSVPMERVEALADQMAFPDLAAEQALAGLRMARMLTFYTEQGRDAVAALDGAARKAVADRIIRESRTAPDDPTLPGLQPGAVRRQARRCLIGALVTPYGPESLQRIQAVYDTKAVTDFTRTLVASFARLNDSQSHAMILKFLEQPPI
ncbi:hypothetical protein [Niveispirillum sp. BGYR6]|uniref:hypothetical protein n=1 Tax=Niveispirillum sp. BGYR6 TaxID=2971249 RepID=UPI0022B9C7FC|nr:hypothetical protein [Niveispirillum sp. BGYR6]MDG5495644.1 hypothetical protein [Niveispirillum sp. BGYR6]